MKPNSSTLKLLLIITLIGILVAGLVATPPASTTASTQSLIVTGKSIDQVIEVVQKHGGEVTSRLDIINGVAVKIPAQQIAALRSEAGIAVSPNAATRLSDYGFEKPAGEKDKPKDPATDYPDLVGAEQAWQQGYVGQGVTVAVLDTGIAVHPSLSLSVDGKKRDLLGWVDFIEGKKAPIDPNGHGTHVAGIIANAAIGADGEWNGVAPGVNMVAVRVLDETGAGTYESVINGLQWVYQHKDEYNIRVVNLSLHSLVQSPYWADPLNQAVMRLWAEGITVVVAAGNSGPGPMTITVPGNVPYVITVGAYTDHYTPTDWSDDYITPFSAAGPTLDNFVKPDVVAPGGHIVAPMMSSSYLARNHDANRVESQYFSMAGTSQAAAVTSGVTALVLSRNPGLTPDQVKYRVMATALAWVTEDQSQALYSIWQQGSGRLNGADAVLVDFDASANQGMDIWADLDGVTHYEGYSYFDSETGSFKLQGDYNETGTDAIGSWSGTIGSWSGTIGSWSGSHYAAWGDAIGSWSGAIGSWSGAIGSWSGAIGSWSGAIGSWSGAIGSWSGAIGSWSGGYTTWIDGMASWIDAIGSWSGAIGSWSGGIGSWSGGIGSWSGGIGSWSGAIGSWSGGIGSWSGAIGSWSGAIGSWSGAIGSWSGAIGSWSGSIVDPAYIQSFSAGITDASMGTRTTVSDWIEEPKP